MKLQLVILGLIGVANCCNAHLIATRSVSENEIKSVRKSVYDREKNSDYWNFQAQKKLREKLNVKQNINRAKNVILFLGDGMSITTITSARIYAGQKLGKSGEDHVLSFEKFPYTALSKPYCVDKQTADSACSATAYLTGVKTNYETIGVDANVNLNNCVASLLEDNQVDSIMQWAQDAKKATGIVTTTRITHASPAGTYAHIANRNWECDDDMRNFTNVESCVGKDIASQLIRNEPGINFNVIFGGGRKKFLSSNIIDGEGEKGQRLDGLDLIDEWVEKKNSPRAIYVHNKKQLENLDHSSVDHVLGLFANSHLDYHLDGNKNQPTLKEMTASAIEILKKNENGFVLFVEGGLIDLGHHANKAKYALDETAEFSEAIQAAVDMTDESETLIVVTADHAHTMTMSGYSDRGTNILKLNTKVSDVDSLPYMTLSYANGPSGGEKRKMISDKDIGELFDF
jgi:alkaline phosphatase